MTEWSKHSWRSFPIRQQPTWPNVNLLNMKMTELSNLPALVFAGETRALMYDLAEASEGKAFLLQCGDCSEDFSGCNGPRIHNLLRVVLQMSLVIGHIGNKKIIKLGRIAGQYAKPRSSKTEIVNGVEIPSYKGDMINGINATPESRTPDPNRILEGYFRAASTLNLIRAFTSGGYAELDKVMDWQNHYFSDTPIMKEYKDVIDTIYKSNKIISTGLNKIDNLLPINDKYYTSHEGLLLEYEEAMTRIDTTTGDWYDTSAHMLWIGDRTRQPDGAHVEFMHGICNPVGIKIGPCYNTDELKIIVDKLNPNNISGRLTFITRFGLKNIEVYLPELIKEIKSLGLNVLWCCDPMHGNTFISNSYKTRNFADIISEIKLFWEICKTEGAIPGGIHLELTGDNVTECIGGLAGLSSNELSNNYSTGCDPRLNAEQAVELAFEIGRILNN